MTRKRRGILLFLSSLVVAAGAALFLVRAPAAPEQYAPDLQAPPGRAADSLRVEGVPESVGIFLENGQAWRAARVMRDYLSETADPAPEALLLAARAEAGWGGWSRVRGYLEDESWLDEVQQGEGWYWLARALEEDEDWEAAWQAYDHYLQASGSLEEEEDRRAVARLRQGLVLLRLDRADEGARLLTTMRSEVPEIAPRIDILAAEALASRGDTAGVRRLIASALDDASLVERGRRALLRAYEEAEDHAGAFALARGYAEDASGSGLAAYALVAARMALELENEEAAREELRRAIRAAPGSAEASGAAELLEEMGGLTTADRLALARVFDARGSNATAAEHYAAWLEAEAGSAEERARVRQAMGQALFDAGDYGDAISAVRTLDTPEALYLTGRAEYRRGNDDRGRDLFVRLAREHPGSRRGSEGLFVVADLAHDDQELEDALPLYREVADEFPGSDRAGLSLMRLAGAAFEAREYEEAARLWEEYRSSYPSGERWLQSTYWAGRAYEAAGEGETAEARYRAVREREPLSYYALQASQRMEEPFWPPELAASPAEDSAAEARVEEWMRGVDLLHAAGLYEEAEAVADRWIRLAGNDRSLLYPLAEALNERGLTIRGIRIGLRLQDSEPANPRLLRIVYPFPYRAMIEAEAEEKGLDPFVVAALVRQESLFKARIASGAGARGLMQVMPETGRGLARAVGIEDWDAELLYQPEINAHLGTIFLAEQMDRWDRSLPSVFSAYNAGPHRVEVWQDFPEYGQEELFTERIPYRETRDYVKILTRNIAIYRGLYGNGE